MAWGVVFGAELPRNCNALQNFVEGTSSTQQSTEAETVPLSRPQLMHITDSERKEPCALSISYASLFSLTRREMGAKNVVEPTIDSGDAGSIQHPPRRTPPPLVGEVNGQFE